MSEEDKIEPSDENSSSDGDSLGVAKDIIELQKKELEIKKEEIALRSKEIDNSHEYAIQALEANKSMYAEMPNERRKDRWQLILSAVGILLIVIAFFIYLFQTDHSDLAAELIKVLIGVILGGGAGYGTGFHNGRKYQKNEEANG